MSAPAAPILCLSMGSGQCRAATVAGFFLFAAGRHSFVLCVNSNDFAADNCCAKREDRYAQQCLRNGRCGGLLRRSCSCCAVGANMGTCTLSTPPGVSCFCNHKVFRSRDHVELGWHFDGRHAVRDGWSATYYKGTHTAFCHRD
jgi:hypothetical protein